MVCCDNFYDGYGSNGERRPLPVAVGVCPDCGNAVDINGETAELDRCGYSPIECETCQYQPCRQDC